MMTFSKLFKKAATGRLIPRCRFMMYEGARSLKSPSQSLTDQLSVRCKGCNTT